MHSGTAGVQGQVSSDYGMRYHEYPVPPLLPTYKSLIETLINDSRKDTVVNYRRVSRLFLRAMQLDSGLELTEVIASFDLFPTSVFDHPCFAFL